MNINEHVKLIKIQNESGKVFDIVNDYLLLSLSEVYNEFNKINGFSYDPKNVIKITNIEQLIKISAVCSLTAEEFKALLELEKNDKERLHYINFCIDNASNLETIYDTAIMKLNDLKECGHYVN